MATVASQQSQSIIGSGAFAMDPSPVSRRAYQTQPPSSPTPEKSRSPPTPRASPHSSRRPSRRPSANADTHNTTAHASHTARTASPPPRLPDLPLTHSSTTMSPTMTATAGHSDDQQESTIRHASRPQNGAATGVPPFSPPPRTSSAQKRHPTSNNGSVSSLPDRSHDTTATSHHPNTRAGTKAVSSPLVSSTPQNHTEDPSSHAANQSSSRHLDQVVSTGPQQSRETTSHAAQSSSQFGETDPVVKRVVLDDPAVDLRRVQEREEEAIPGPELDQADSSPLLDDHAGHSPVTPRSRQDFSAQNAASAGRRGRETKFGEYVLGQTLGEGEFGKVKLGWKKDGSVQVAIKLIRRESLGSNPSRLPKIHREINILETLHHPNIVKLHEMVETSQYIGIILEYASGGELFDYILTHRYLKDNTARKLFAQLVSGVGYLHKKGIVHRDLKLENLLLDRNRNIIITDFGFANTFDARDELGDEIEYNLTDRNFVKRMDLERVRNGTRRGDLMATSCGSPCYAAPELVVTDSLYTGRKVDVWSCGVILYAMLAGYLPFDDDPDNPEGDNINLLYKYITTTPLTFPEYVTPHARDLLRRILVADPRKRADLFEVARHSWLSDFAHVVAQVTSSTTTVGDIANTTVRGDTTETPGLARSHSVREPSKTVTSAMSPAIGGLAHQGKIDPATKAADKNKASKEAREAKRRTVQVEYVAPQSQTVRGEDLPAPDAPEAEYTSYMASPGSAKGRVNGATDRTESVSRPHGDKAKPMPHDSRQRPTTYQPSASSKRNSQHIASSPRDPAALVGRGPQSVPRSVSDSTGAFGITPSSMTRPQTGGSMTSNSHGRLPSRGNSYSQPLAPTVAATNAQGRVTQPKSENKYNISNPMPFTEPYRASDGSRPNTQHYMAPPTLAGHTDHGRSHKRSNTLGNFFRTGSMSGPRSQTQSPSVTPQREKRYPPTSMKTSMPAETTPRPSTDSRRPSFSFGRKSSDLRTRRDTAKLSTQDRSRRFSLLPASFSFKNLTGTAGSTTKEEARPMTSDRRTGSSNDRQSVLNRTASRPQTMHYSSPPTMSGPNDDDDALAEGVKQSNAGELSNGELDGPREQPSRPSRNVNHSRAVSQGLSASTSPYPNSVNRRPVPGSTTAKTVKKALPQQPRHRSTASYADAHHDSDISAEYEDENTGVHMPTGPKTHYDLHPPSSSSHHDPIYPPGFNSEESAASHTRPARVLTKNHRRFEDAYNSREHHDGSGGQHAGSSGAAKRVMDFFRRRGKARGGNESMD